MDVLTGVSLNMWIGNDPLEGTHETKSQGNVLPPSCSLTPIVWTNYTVNRRILPGMTIDRSFSLDPVFAIGKYTRIPQKPTQIASSLQKLFILMLLLDFLSLFINQSKNR